MRLLWLHKRAPGLVPVLLLGTLLGGGCGPSEPDRVRTARALYAQWHLRDAEAVLQPLFERPPPPADSTALLYAEVLFGQRELLRARAVLEPLAQTDDAVGVAALRHLAHTHFFLGYPDTASVLARRLLRHARQRNEVLPQAQAHHILGLTGFYRAAYDSALIHQQASLRLARRAGHIKTEADALRQIGVLAWYRGRNEEALTAYYEPALALYRQIDDKIGEATTLSNIGLIYQGANDEEANVRHQLMAFGIRKRIGDQVGLSDSYVFLANNPYVRHPDSRMHDWGHTYAYVRKSLEISTRIGYSWGREIAARALERRFDQIPLENLGRWIDSVEVMSGEGRLQAQSLAALKARLAGRWEEAIALSEEHYAHLDALGLDKFHTLTRRVIPLRRLGRWGEIEPVLREAQAERPDDRRVRGALAEYFIETGQPERAEALLKPLMAHYDSLYLQKLFETEPGMAFERAVGSVHLARADLYVSLVQALARAGKTQEAFTYIEQERALPFWGEREPGDTQARTAVSRFVQLLDQFDAHPERFEDMEALLVAVSEMQLAMVAEQQVLSQTAPPHHALAVTSPAALQRVLQPGEVFVAYLLGRTHDELYPLIEDDASHALVVRRDTIALFPLAATPKALLRAIDIHRQTLLRGQDRPGDTVWRASAHRLYTLLLAPLAERGLLRPGEHLIVSPHRSLHLVPFHALTTTPKTQAPRFIVEEHVVSYVPSATFMVEARQRAPGRLESVLAVAPDGRSLPFSDQEVRSIPAELFARRTVIRNGEARADAVLRALEHYDAVHLAAHARMNQRFPLYSHITFPDRRLELHEIMQRTLRARLVVLSACETGRGVGAFGEVFSRDDLVSFSRALLTAGAATVVASLWLVEDAATASLMEKFYAHLNGSSASAFQTVGQQASPGLAAALAQAQRQFLAEARAAGSKTHPFYWAGFYLTGDGR